MAAALDWDTLYKAARRNIRPTYRKLRKMDADDWLANVGLERRNVAVDIAAASGFILLGCAVGVSLGLLLAPRPGRELRKDLNKRVRETAERIGVSGQQQPSYAS